MTKTGNGESCRILPLREVVGFGTFREVFYLHFLEMAIGGTRNDSVSSGVGISIRWKGRATRPGSFRRPARILLRDW